MDVKILFADTEFIDAFRTELFSGFQKAGRKVFVVGSIGESLRFETEGAVLLVWPAGFAGVFAV